MRIDSPKPYGPPVQPKEAVENTSNRAARLPERAMNAAGDQFELSAEQKVTQVLVGSAGGASGAAALSPERLTELRGKIGTGYYLTPSAAEATAKAVADFHRATP